MNTKRILMWLIIALLFSCGILIVPSLLPATLTGDWWSSSTNGRVTLRDDGSISWYGHEGRYTVQDDILIYTPDNPTSNNPYAEYAIIQLSQDILVLQALHDANKDTNANGDDTGRYLAFGRLPQWGID